MKRSGLPIVITCFVLVCCSDSNTVQHQCTSTNIADYPWTKTLQESMQNCVCEISIAKGTYRNQTVIYEILTDPLCDGINNPVLYTCQGKIIRAFTTSEADQQELMDHLKLETILYRCQ